MKSTICSLQYGVLLILLYIELHLSSASAAEFAHIKSDLDVISRVPMMEVACDGRISIDSLAANMPLPTSKGPYMPYYPSVIDAKSVVNEIEETYSSAPEYVSFVYHSLYVPFARMVEDTLHTSMTNIVLFEIDSTKKGPGILGTTNPINPSAEAHRVCSVEWDPRKSWLVDHIEVTSLTFALLETINTIKSKIEDEKYQSCRKVGIYHKKSGAQLVSLESPLGSEHFYTNTRVTTLNSRLVSSANGESDDVGMDNVFPLIIKSSAYNCKVTIAMIASRHGRFTAVVKWLPLAIYSVMFMPLVIFCGRKRVRKGTIAGVGLTVVTYIGFLGCCIGLGIEIATWHYPIHPFPFPGGVTIYLCSAVFYGFLIMGLLWNHPTGCVATSSGLNMILYGMSVGLLVGYFIRHFLIIGCVAIGILGFTNVVMLCYLAYFSSALPQSFREHTGACHMGTLISWFPITAIIVPVSYFSLEMTWTGLPVYIFKNKYEEESSRIKALSVSAEDTNTEQDDHSISKTSTVYERMETDDESTNPHQHIKSRLAVVKLHTAISNIIMITCHHLCALALLVTACIYHTPFVVCLFPFLVVYILYIAFAAQEYSIAWRRWGKGNLLLSLSRAIVAFASLEAPKRKLVQISVSRANSNGTPEESFDGVLQNHTRIDRPQFTQAENGISSSNQQCQPQQHNINSSMNKQVGSRFVPSYRTVQSVISTPVEHSPSISVYDREVSHHINPQRSSRQSSVCSAHDKPKQWEEGSRAVSQSIMTQDEMLRIREERYLNILNRLD